LPTFVVSFVCAFVVSSTFIALASGRQRVAQATCDGFTLSEDGTPSEEVKGFVSSPSPSTSAPLINLLNIKSPFKPPFKPSLSITIEDDGPS